MDRPLAWQFFEVDSKRDLIEDRISSALTASDIRFSDWTADGYDGSIEIYGFDGRLSVDQQAALWALGFDRAWTHPGESKVKELEIYYAAPSRKSA